MSYFDPVTRPPENPDHRYVWVVVCDTCRRVKVLVWGQEHCLCTQGSHLDRMVERVRP